VNLIHNALQAMEDRKHRHIRIGTSSLPSGMVEISVADTSTGLSAEPMPRLFEPFVSTKHKGMGLGLSISRSIIEAHGGEIRAEPNPDGGVSFCFTLATSTEGAIDDR
jgi:two-component system sensor kinase FixL